MRRRWLGIAATAAAVTLAAAFVAAQGTTANDRADGPPVVQGQAPPAQGPMGQGRAMGPGRGPGQGRGQGLGPGQGSGQRLGPRGGRGGQAMGRGTGRGGGLMGLDLTDDQRAKITDLQRATRDQAAPLQDELALARRTLHRELFADARDNAKVGSLAKQVAALEQQLADLHVKEATALADLLTAEQRETMRLHGGGGLGPSAGVARRGGAGRGRGRGGLAPK